MFAAQVSAAEATGDMIGARQAFYACDGISRSMVKLSQAYLLSQGDETPDTDGLRDAVAMGGGMAHHEDAVKLPALTPPGFRVTDFSLQIDPSGAITSPLPSGPFQGMNARQTPVSLFVRGEKEVTGHACEARQQLVLAQIGLFQFFVFAETFADLQNPASMTVDGRIHVNGDFCATSQSAYRLELKRITAAGGIYAHCNSCPGACSTTAVATAGFYVYDGDAYSTTMTSNNDHGCTNCRGSGLPWREYAPATWSNHALDSAHEVPKLRVPVSGAPPVQDGITADNRVSDNSPTQRFLIDPPLFDHLVADLPIAADDAEDVRGQKFACKADIRIINGVWYKRAAGDDVCETWPGEPIWSDHPGNFQIQAHEELGLVGAMANVGQADLAPLQGWAGAPGSRPVGYSYYRSTDAGLLLSSTFSAAGRPTISYGSLVRVAGVDRPPNLIGEGGISGFEDPRVRYREGAAQASILPINFDVAAFGEALMDPGPGELGSHFPDPADFNGIVWVTSTWPNQLDGFGNQGTSGALRKEAALWPPPAAVTGGTARLPYPLCSHSPGGTVTTTPPLSTPACADAQTPRPSALRLINGAELDPDAFPKGLTIATNLPAYVLREFNVNPSGDEDNWRPVLIATDALTLMSNNYDETRFVWGGGFGLGNRMASDTSYHFALIAGDVTTSKKGPGGEFGGGINNFPRFIEDWTNRTAHIRGSLVLGFRSVFQRQRWHLGPVYRAPDRDWEYETNFDVLSRHPPGAPMYEVQAMKRWNRN